MQRIGVSRAKAANLTITDEQKPFAECRRTRARFHSVRLNLSKALALLCLSSLPLSAKDSEALPPGSTLAGKTVRVSSNREGNHTRFFVENQEYCEITMTFEVKLVNLRGSVTLPYTATFPARKTTEAFALEPVDPTEKWEFSYTNYHKLGSYLARHDDSVVYQLPYAPGKKFIVTQAYNSSFSHKGANQYAIDWKMPEGTLVYAARGGLVVKTKDDSSTGGASMRFDSYNNYVLIRHDDGTLAHYCHLEKGGALVKPGDSVLAGQPIARSGNTGFSSGPHLHFCIFKTVNGRERVSIPVKFRTAEASAVTLQEDHRYCASETAVGGLADPGTERPVNASR